MRAASQISLREPSKLFPTAATESPPTKPHQETSGGFKGVGSSEGAAKLVHDSGITPTEPEKRALARP